MIEIQFYRTESDTCPQEEYSHDMRDDVEKYIERRKRADKAFAKDFDEGYEEFKVGVMLRQAREEAGVTQ